MEHSGFLDGLQKFSAAMILPPVQAGVMIGGTLKLAQV
jgi:hypothetical protein